MAAELILKWPLPATPEASARMTLAINEDCYAVDARRRETFAPCTGRRDNHGAPPVRKPAVITALR